MPERRLSPARIDGAAVVWALQFLVARIFASAPRVFRFACFGYAATAFILSAVGQRQWGGVAVSADGQTVVGAGDLQVNSTLDGIYISTNQGAFWRQTSAPSNAWSSVSCSADGAFIIACSRSLSAGAIGAVYLSRDRGLTWTNTGLPNLNWSSVTCSTNGLRIYALSSDSTIQASADAGATWLASSLTNGPSGDVACSAEGLMVAVACSDGIVALSDNAAASFHYSLVGTNAGLLSVAMSGDGAALVVGGSSVGGAFVSTNFGASWAFSSLATNGSVSVAGSIDGSRWYLAGEVQSFTSTNRAGTWVAATFPTLGSCEVSASADGGTLVMVGKQTGRLAISQDGGLTWQIPAGFPPAWLGTGPVNAFTASAAMTADGSFLAGLSNTTILVSTNGGGNWLNSHAPNHDWKALVCSADGSRMTAASAGFTGNPTIVVSTNQGATWTTVSAPLTRWADIAGSADGTRLLLGASSDLSGYGVPLYFSKSAGRTWQPSGSEMAGWSSVACSADGSLCFATSSSRGYILTPPGAVDVSHDGGLTWTNTTLPAARWSSVACSVDGQVVVAGAQAGTQSSYVPLYVSRDGGGTWSNSGSVTNMWSAVATSADGRVIIGAQWGTTEFAGRGMLALSHDSGATWITQELKPSAARAYSVACSADGSVIFLIMASGFSYLYQSVNPPLLSARNTANGPALEWIVPAGTYKLQQRDDLESQTWIDAAAVVTLSSTNLRYQTVLPPPPSTRFYRLQSR